jgi:hypothetical protein
MESQLAQIGIQQTTAKQYIKQPKAEITIQQPAASISMKTTPAKLQIDQSRAWEDMDLMHITKRNEKFAEASLQAVQQGMSRRAAEGRELMMIEKEGNPISQQAAVNSRKVEKTLGIAFIPSPFSVKINYEPAQVDIDVQVNKPLIDAKRNHPEMQYKAGSVDIHMKQDPVLHIDFIYPNEQERKTVQ